MTNSSALLGQPPATQNDYYIQNALLLLSPSQINPDPAYPFAPPAPANPSPSRAKYMIIGQSFAIAIIAIITIIRLLTRKFYLRSWGMDDWVIIPGILGGITYITIDIIAETKGCLGEHQWDCTYEKLGWFYVMGRAADPIFYFAVFTVKTSIALANGRITGLQSQKWTIAYWISLFIVLGLLISTVTVNIFQCNPVRPFFSIIALGKMEDPADLKCIDINAVSLSFRALHICTDWMLLSVPIIIIYRLNVSVTIKLRLAFVFGIGAMSSIATIVRETIIFNDNPDVTYNEYTVYAWNIVDVFFACIVASLPALNAPADLVMKKTKELVSSMSGSSTKTQTSSHALPQHDLGRRADGYQLTGSVKSSTEVSQSTIRHESPPESAV